MTELLIGRAITTFVTCGTVLDMTARVSNHISSLLSEDFEKVKICLKKLDLRAKLNSIESIMSHCQKLGHFNVKSDTSTDTSNNTNTEISLSIEGQLPVDTLIIDNYQPPTQTIIKDDVDLNQSIIDDYLSSKSSDNLYKSSNPIETHIYYIYEITKEIGNELENIDKKIANHKTLYANSYRKLNVDKSLANLEAYDLILKQRYERFINLLAIPYMHSD